VGNPHQAYAESRGLPMGPAEIFAALGDMVTYNGGRPFTCLV
jgi:cyclase